MFHRPNPTITWDGQNLVLEGWTDAELLRFVTVWHNASPEVQAMFVQYVRDKAAERN